MNLVIRNALCAHIFKTSALGGYMKHLKINITFGYKSSTRITFIFDLNYEYLKNNNVCMKSKFTFFSRAHCYSLCKWSNVLVVFNQSLTICFHVGVAVHLCRRQFDSFSHNILSDALPTISFL